MDPHYSRKLKTRYLVAPAVLLAVNLAFAQTDAPQVGAVLNEEILAPSTALFQLRQYILERVAKPPAPSSAQQWTNEAKRLRQHLLNDVVFHGWPKDWVTAPPKFEDLGVFASGPGYRMRKLRYEIVPGFQSTAILYEPERMEGKIPAILNLNGHVGAIGKAVEYKQKRCINYAKRGILTLNLDWLGMGELGQNENQHWFGAHLDLVGVNEVGLFFLAMRRGLDYLDQHPNADRSRLGVTGLSGGGWQTILLSSLDERVAVAVPVAGFSSVSPRIEARWFGDLGDPEQSATDLFDGQDYPHLAALRAPRPTLLVYNAEDDCCFRAPMVKPLVYDAIKPVFKLFGREDALGWHENHDPGTHNYQLDNRIQSYKFFGKHFNIAGMDNEIPSDAEIKSYDELVVGLPKDNLTLLGLAQKLGKEIQRPPVPPEGAARGEWAASERTKLARVVRYKPVTVKRLWTVATTKGKGIETFSHLFEMSDGLSANGVRFKALDSPQRGPAATIILHDKGKKAAGNEVSDRVNRGEHVLALDLVFTGDAWKEVSQGPFYGPVGSFLYQQFLHGLGDRPLGIEAAQLIAITQWVRDRAGVDRVRVESTGMRNHVAALVAAALQPDLFSDLVVHEGLPSLGYLLEAPVAFHEAPEIFCLDLYKEFDLDRLAIVAVPTRVKLERAVELPKK